MKKYAVLFFLVSIFALGCANNLATRETPGDYRFVSKTQEQIDRNLFEQPFPGSLLSDALNGFTPGAIAAAANDFATSE